MSYWISLVSPDLDHREIWNGVHCSWNYSRMMIALPCGWAKDWQGKQAKDMIPRIEASLFELEVNPTEYSKYELDPARGLGTMGMCHRILTDCARGFRQYPEGIIRID